MHILARALVPFNWTMLVAVEQRVHCFSVITSLVITVATMRTLEHDAALLVCLSYAAYCHHYYWPSTVDNCTDGSMRLVGGKSPNEGRVEICLNGQWGTVCDDSWGSVDAQVACRQLGYQSTGIELLTAGYYQFLFASAGALAFTNAYFSQGTGPIQLDNVACTGSEPTILQCSHLTIDNCGHYEDAGIRCRGKITLSLSVNTAH